MNLGLCRSEPKNSTYESSHKHSNQHEQDHTQHMSIAQKAMLYRPTETNIERQCKQKQYHRANEVSKQSSKQASKLNTCDRKQARNLCSSACVAHEASIVAFILSEHTSKLHCAFRPSCLTGQMKHSTVDENDLLAFSMVS